MTEDNRDAAAVLAALGRLVGQGRGGATQKSGSLWQGFLAAVLALNPPG